MEENKSAPQEQPKPNFLEEVKAERMALEKVRDENREIVNRLEQMKAEAIMSGRTDAGTTQQQKPAVSPKDYAQAALNNRILN